VGVLLRGQRRAACSHVALLLHLRARTSPPRTACCGRQAARSNFSYLPALASQPGPKTASGAHKPPPRTPLLRVCPSKPAPSSPAHHPVLPQGLSHYLEHMLFMGSAKYPDEHEYDEFLAAHGGSSNAFTELVRGARRAPGCVRAPWWWWWRWVVLAAAASVCGCLCLWLTRALGACPACTVDARIAACGDAT
jgi:hypothetical protein